MNKKKETKKLTLEDVWAMFAETDRRLAESRAEADRRLAESRAETDRRLAESRAEADKRAAERQAEADKRQAEADKRAAERQAEADKRQAEADKRAAERQAEADKRAAEADKRSKALDEKLDKLCGKVGGIDANVGFHAEQFFQDALAETLTFGGEKYDLLIKNLEYSAKDNDGEFDIVLVNGKSIAIIEVKHRIHPNFVKTMATERIAVFRKLFPVYQKHKAYLGIAGLSFSKAVLEEAEKCGIGIIRQVGKSVEIEAEHLKAY